ncbi:NADP-dependent oxidoreductase [Pontibacillus yanchengensis]|uniref:Alcohol dehydrogenase n=1 Tax=Pontibacillus yanchengensis Y32 TaxID=1385514 RepID=A0A0A2TAR1_9BACI|nr:NADP-dependent oxidoreductase [Pontibacillus yanchengensis]KGP71166.1 alcohol dehydrogenase [Pontibacillus yanchengensis Y32]
MSHENEQIVLASRPEGMPTHENFTYETIDTKPPQKGEVVVKSLYISVDPYMRGRMSDQKSYVEPFQLNEVISGGVVGEVIESQDSDFEVGDKVFGMLGWRRFNVVPSSQVRKVDGKQAPLSAYLSVLGLTGLTAYFGLLDIGQPKEGETVVVSGAAGAVGMVVGQIAKIKGAHVVGIAGSDEKVRYLVEGLGFDAAINYKTVDDVQEALAGLCPQGVDVYFDNVGGEISDAVLNLLNSFARVPLCGAISSYNRTDADLGPRVQTKLLKARAGIQAFIVGDYAERFSEGAKELAKWLAEGKLKNEETIIDGFENIPEAFFGLFQGENLGKQLVKVAEPDQE